MGPEGVPRGGAGSGGGGDAAADGRARHLPIHAPNAAVHRHPGATRGGLAYYHKLSVCHELMDSS
jgi:hypothetical protein